jgi:hypothetical protein
LPDFKSKRKMRFTAYLVIFLLISYSPLISSISFKNISLQKVCDDFELSADQCCIADKALKFLGYGGLAAAAGTYGVPFVLAQLGFTATGVIGGSLAAWWQSVGIAPSVFATFQSASMTGAAATMMTKIGISAAALKSYFSSCDVKTPSDKENCNKNQKC